MLKGIYYTINYTRLVIVPRKVAGIFPSLLIKNIPFIFLWGLQDTFSV
jgi:hypothetical protein